MSTISRGFLVISLCLAGAALAGLPEVRGHLNRNDVPAAQAEVARLGGAGSRDPNVLAAVAETAFYAGDFPAALDTLDSAIDAGYDDTDDDRALYERTLFATAGWVRQESDGFVIRWRPGLDALLVDDAFATLAQTRSVMEPLLGAGPPGAVALEIFPDGGSFIAASSLTKEDVYTTGVVALSKWSRLLLTSPRAQARGYGWRDTIAHEYIHLVVAHQTNNRAPVWLQEAIAKYLDNRWTDGDDHFVLDARSAGLLGDALANDDFVSFEEMHPSLAKLPTADRAALAYSQLATLMEYCFEVGGPDVLRQALPAVGAGVDPRVALATAAGKSDFAELEGAWKQWLSTQGYAADKIDALPTVLDGGDEQELDPLLADREDLHRFVAVGGMFVKRAAELDDAKEAELFRRAALVEYAKAVPEGEDPSPLLANRIAEARLALGETDRAITLLRESATDYPEFTLTQKQLGEAWLTKGDLQASKAAYENARALNPFDPQVLEALAAIYDKVGDVAARDRVRAALDLRAKGGGGFDLPAMHDRVGEYELPSARMDTRKDELPPEIGRPFPAATLRAVDGRDASTTTWTGKVVVVDFWATWCGPCRKSMPDLDRLAKAHPADLLVVGISDEPAPKVTRFLSNAAVSYPIVAATDPTRLGLKVAALPTMYVVGRDGRVVDVIVGADTARVERAVTAALAAR